MSHKWKDLKHKVDSQSRTFVFFPRPSVADPAHVLVVSELRDGKVIETYSDLEEVKRFIHSIEREMIKDEGRHEETVRIMALLGVETYPELLALRRNNGHATLGG